MEQQQIKALIDAMSASDLAEMEFSQDGWTLRLVRRPADDARPSPLTPGSTSLAGLLSSAAGASAIDAADAASNPPPLCAPLYGVVHLSAAPGEAPFVAAGDAVTAGQILCVIEAMKVFNQIRAEHDAVVAELLVASGQEVEAGQPLLRFS